MKPKNERPAVDNVLPLADALYARVGGGVGCCLHIVLDDGNVQDSCVQHSIERALEEEHDDCFDLSCLLLSMSRTQRLKLSSKISRNPSSTND